MDITSHSPVLSQDRLTAFHTADPLLNEDPIVALYGISSTISASGAPNSRIQVHILTPAGLQSFPRLSISPSAAHYKAVESLPRAEQGDEVCRGLAFGLLKYFSELPEAAKNAWIQHSLRASQPAPVRLFSEDHAAQLASHMTKVEDSAAVVRAVESAFAPQNVPFLDVDVVLPDELSKSRHGKPQTGDTDRVHCVNYGIYAPLVAMLGDCSHSHKPATRQAHSITAPKNGPTNFTKVRKEGVRLEMCGLLDTEERYVDKLQELLTCITVDSPEIIPPRPISIANPGVGVLENLLLPSLEQLFEGHSKFLEDLQHIISDTENAAIADIEATLEDPVHWGLTLQVPTLDATGATLLAECLLRWIPSFATNYENYFRHHAQLCRELKQLLSNGDSPYARHVHNIGEQRLMSLLIEPIQRLPRYNLYIANIIKSLPSGHQALGPLTNATVAIAKICSEDLRARSPSHRARLEQLVSSWPPGIACQGSFITAVDALKLQPPYDLENTNAEQDSHILLLFTDLLITLRKTSQSAPSAAHLALDLDTAPTPVLDPSKQNHRRHNSLEFYSSAALSAMHFAERNGGKVIVVALATQPTRSQDGTRQLPDTSLFNSTSLFQLQGSYQGRASDFIETLVQTRVESRLVEANQENATHNIRKLQRNNDAPLGLLFTLYQEGKDNDRLHGLDHAPIRIIVDRHQCNGKHQLGHDGTEMVVSIYVDGNGFYTMECEALNERTTRDKVTLELVVPVLSKRSMSHWLCIYQTEC